MDVDDRLTDALGHLDFGRHAQIPVARRPGGGNDRFGFSRMDEMTKPMAGKTISRAPIFILPF